jgi:predicted RNA-binding protein with PIN domain
MGTRPAVSLLYNVLMPYLIDGHNLIPKLGLRLEALDDENQLIEILKEFCRLSRKQVDVYFDGAPPGQPTTRKFGALTAHFVRKPQIADEAIRRRLEKLGNAARNWIVVSADHRVQAEARAAHATFITSEAFAQLVTETLRPGESAPDGKSRVSDREIKEWLEIFGKDE